MTSTQLTSGVWYGKAELDTLRPSSQYMVQVRGGDVDTDRCEDISVNMVTVLRSPVSTMRDTASFLKSPSSQLPKKVMEIEMLIYSPKIMF